MTDRKTCPVPSCGGSVAAGHLMCQTCWQLVPGQLQRKVHSTWRGYRLALHALRRLGEIAEVAQGGCVSAVDAARDYQAACEAATNAVVAARP